ncbi:hypothetical protein BGZ80_010850 [Entomortierella chlamydospora]|uniref:Uncharacterized protein n=1 Tax=Entomortierella chlamydospora TaxID=101097 RepID=A0A9P6MV30_9FUNG|nr:hypothetical protein BGZ79_010692 [Entomortierella chlamydospora]KAG0013805.1 hypothetical protein BGZ80_010850 [Entomortierella chlamydospora]
MNLHNQYRSSSYPQKLIIRSPQYPWLIYLSLVLYSTLSYAQITVPVYDMEYTALEEESNPTPQNGSRKGIIGGALAAVLVVISMALCWIWCLKSRRRRPKIDLKRLYRYFRTHSYNHTDDAHAEKRTRSPEAVDQYQGLELTSGMYGAYKEPLYPHSISTLVSSKTQLSQPTQYTPGTKILRSPQKFRHSFRTPKQSTLESTPKLQGARSMIYANLTNCGKDEVRFPPLVRARSRFRRSPQDHSQLELMQEFHQTRISHLFPPQAPSNSLQLYPSEEPSSNNQQTSTTPPCSIIIHSISNNGQPSTQNLECNQQLEKPSSVDHGEELDQETPDNTGTDSLLPQHPTLTSGSFPTPIQTVNISLTPMCSQALQQRPETLSISSEDQLMLEQQIADYQAEHDMQYLRQQQILERLRLEKEAERETLQKLEMLQRRLRSKKENQRH